MKRSTDRILTTHMGSLPRPDMLADLLVARAEGKSVDAARIPENMARVFAFLSAALAPFGKTALDRVD